MDFRDARACLRRMRAICFLFLQEGLAPPATSHSFYGPRFRRLLEGARPCEFRNLNSGIYRGAPGLSRACPFEAKGRLPGGVAIVCAPPRTGTLLDRKS